MPRMLATNWLEERVDERRDRRTLGQHQQNAKQNQSDHDWRQPILLVLLHELPEFAYNLYFGHVDSSKHFFIMARIALPLRIRLPVRIGCGRAPMQRVPSGQALDETNRRDDDKENESENNSRADERQTFRQRHPGFVWINQRARKHEAEQHQHGAQWQGDCRGAVKLAAISPPGAQQNQHPTDDQSKLSRCPQRSFSSGWFGHLRCQIRDCVRKPGANRGPRAGSPRGVVDATGSYTQFDSMIRSLPRRVGVLKRYSASLRRQPQNGLCPRLSGCVASARINQRAPSLLSPASLAA